VSNREKIIIAGGLLFILIAGFFLWFFFIRPGVAMPPSSTGTPLFPSGQSVSFPGSTTKGAGGGNVGSQSTSEEKMGQPRKITDVPVAGALFTENADGPAIRYMERETGHIYETPLQTNSEKVRVTNTTIPKVHDVFWQNDGQSLIARYLSGKDNNIQIFAAQIIKSVIQDDPGTLDGSFLPKGAYELTENPSGRAIFYLLHAGEGAVGITADFKNAQAKQIFSHPFTDWSVEWPAEGIVALQTKPSGGVAGFLYFLDVKTGALTKILGNIAGLTALVNPTADKVLYSESTEATNTALKTHTYDIKTKKSADFSVTTLPEKCVWSRKEVGLVYCFAPGDIGSGRYPDVWYQGLTSFRDSLWSIDVTTGATKSISSPSYEASVDIDAINPRLSENEDFVSFMNKKDSLLWVLRLK
jgi:hypothetical protein